MSDWEQNPQGGRWSGSAPDREKSCGQMCSGPGRRPQPEPSGSCRGPSVGAKEQRQLQGQRASFLPTTMQPWCNSERTLRIGRERHRGRDVVSGACSTWHHQRPGHHVPPGPEGLPSPTPRVVASISRAQKSPALPKWAPSFVKSILGLTSRSEDLEDSRSTEWGWPEHEVPRDTWGWGSQYLVF